MGRAIFIGERSYGLAAIGMLVSGRGAEQQGWARGREGGRGGWTLGLPRGRPSAQPITSGSRPDARLSAAVLATERTGWARRRRVETSATVWRSKGRSQQWGPRSDISVVWAAWAPLFGPDFICHNAEAFFFPTCSKVFIRSHNLCPQILRLFCAKLKTGSAVLHCLTRARCEGCGVIVNNAPLCLECCSGPTDANIFVFWLCTLRALLFIIRPHKKSWELKEQKKTKTGKQKVQQLKENRKPKQENKAMKQWQYLFPVHLHSHLYFIAPKRFLVLVKVTLYPGRLRSSWMTVREPQVMYKEPLSAHPMKAWFFWRMYILPRRPGTQECEN